MDKTIFSIYPNEQANFEELTGVTSYFVYDNLKIGEHKKEMFEHILRAYRLHNFADYYHLKYKYMCTSNEDRVVNYFSYLTEHPIVHMLGDFMECGLLDNKLNDVSSQRIIPLGEELYSSEKLKQMGIDKGVILPNGDLITVNAEKVHNILAMWLYLNDVDLSKCVRYTYGGDGFTPYFSSFSSFTNMESSDQRLTTNQARAICNIFKCTSNINDFERLIVSSDDLCIHPLGNQEVRYANTKKFERVLDDEFNLNTTEFLMDLKKRSYMCRDKKGYEY